MNATQPGLRQSAIVSTAIVAAGYLASRVLGLVRDIIILNTFGTGPLMDAYRAAFTVPDLIYLGVAGGALGTAFIPIFAEFLGADDQTAAWQLATAVAKLAFAGLALTSAAIALFAEPLVRLVFGGFTPQYQAVTVDLMRLMLLQPILLGIGGLAKATLESFDLFLLPAIGSNLYNIGIIAGALLLAPRLGIVGLVYGVLCGALLFVLVQLPGLRRVGARFASADVAVWRVPGVGRVLRLLGPRIFGQSIWQINITAIAAFAASAGTGAVAASAAALQLMLLPHGLIALSLGTVLFPHLSRLFAAGEVGRLRSIFADAVGQIVFLTLPAALLLGLLATPVLRLLFQRGAFDAHSVALTSMALATYAVGLAAFAAAEIVVRTSYAMQDTRTPVLVGVAAVLINILLAALLVRPLGIAGLGLAFSIANIAECGILLLLLRRRLGGLAPNFARSLAGMAIAGGFMAGAIVSFEAISAPWLPFVRAGDTYRWPTDAIPLALWLLLVAAVSFGIYLAVAAALGLPNVRLLLGRLRAVMGRIGTRA